MKFLILGASSFARRRVIPTLTGMNIISTLAVASRSQQGLPESIYFYSDYMKALDQFKPDVVYISLINSLHYFWAKQALERNIHVIVDKPAFLSLAETQDMIELANKQKVCLAEALIYQYHSQIAFIKNFMIERKIQLRQLVAQFSFPPLAKENFRNDLSLGGGAANDLGPYAISIGRIFFEKLPLRDEYQLTGCHTETGADTSFSVMAQYENGQSYIGSFGFNTQYRNRLSFLCDNLIADVDRLFTTTIDTHNTLAITEGTQNYTLELPASDAMRNFLDAFFLHIQERKYDDFHDQLLEDARQMDRLRHAISKQNLSV